MKGIFKNNEFEICVFSRPGTLFSNAVNVATALVEDSDNELKKDDFMIIVAGSNDVGRGHLKFNWHELKQLASKVNLVVAQIPIRRDLPPSNEDLVEDANYRLSRVMTQVGGRFMPIMSTVRDFTRHGLHYNLRGKAKVAQNIYNTIMNYFPVVPVTEM